MNEDYEELNKEFSEDEILDEDDYYFDEEDIYDEELDYDFDEDDDEDYDDDSPYQKAIDTIDRIICIFISAVILLSILCPIIIYFPKEKFSNFIDYGTYDGVIINDCDASNIYLRKLDKELDNVPAFIKSEFFESGGEIHVVNYLSDSSNTLGENFRIVGQYNVMENNIYMLYSFDNTDAIVHEFGHYFDVSHEIIDSKFVEIYKTEAESFSEHVANNSHFTSTTREFFAEGFNQFIYEPERLDKACPELSLYIQDKIIKYNKLYNEKNLN